VSIPPNFFQSLAHACHSDIIKLTALYTARRGRPFIHALTSREARNFQFDFLRPNHSLFGYFNRLVEQYTRVLHPPRELLAKIALHATPEGKWDMLAESRERAAYERWRRDREKKREDDQEAERSTSTILPPCSPLTKRVL
jgi:splicing factor 3A subunit 1